MSKSKKKEENEQKREFVKWSEQMDSVFIDAMLEQKANGNKIDGSFTAAAYQNMVKICVEKTGIQLTKDHLKNRLKTLKANFYACYDVFKNKSGFGWNPISRKFEAEPEVWKPLIEANPDAKKWMTIPFNNYEKLFDLFAQDKATGEGAISAKEKNLQWANEEDGARFDDVSVFGPSNSSCGVQFEDGDPTSPVYSSSKANFEVEASSKSKKRKGASDSFDKEFEIMNNGIKDVADAMREGNAIAARGIAILEKKGQPSCSESELFQELLNIGISESCLLDAFLFLVKSEAQARAFLAVPTSLRRELLYKMMDLSDSF